jgi:sulfite exporter TauE/SafE
MNAFAGMSELASEPGTRLLTLSGAAFVAGLAASVHCFAMCGPLACYGCSRSPVRSGKSATMGAYHVARVAAYGLVGSLFGLAGAGVVRLTPLRSPRWLPWAMAAVLLATAFGLGERLVTLPGLAQLVRRVTRRAASFAPVVRSGVMGALTPLLPCGLLYGLFATSLLTGGFVAGGTLAAAYALGGVPALTLAQLQSRWMHRLPRGADVIVRRILPAVAALLLVYRALNPEQCPLCH